MRTKGIMKMNGSFVLAAAVLLPVLCGCGAQGTENTAGTIPNESCIEFTPVEQHLSISLTDSVSAGEEEETVEASEFEPRSTDTKLLSAITSDGYTNIEWSLDWENASSSWASGKAVSDYMTVTPDEEDARNATVTNLKSFGEPIIVTAMRRDNRLSASVQCDYLRKVAPVNTTNYCAVFGTMKEIGGNYVGDQESALVLDGSTPFSISYLAEGSYTVQGELNIAKMNFYSTDARNFGNAINASQYFQSAKALVSTLAVRTQTELVNGEFFDFGTVSYSESGDYVCMTCNVKFSVGDFFNCGAAGYENLKTANPECAKYLQWAVYDAFSNVTTVSRIRCFLGIQYKYQGEIYSSGAIQSVTMTNLGFDFSKISVPPLA